MGVAEGIQERDFTADITQLWRVVTDTDHLGRVVGFAQIEAHPIAGAGAARYRIKTKLGGLVVEYEELPFEWIEPERFASHRVCTRGPFRSIDQEWTLARRPDGGTHVKLRMAVVPKLGILLPLARAALRKGTAAMMAAVAGIDERLARKEPPFLLGPIHGAQAAALDRAAAQLRALAPGEQHPLVDRLVALVRGGADPDVAKIRPFELAAAWGADRRAVVALCLQGVVAGLLQLSWDIVCPSCRLASEQAPSLSDLAETGHCHLCDLSFGIDLDRAVEATFVPAASVRHVEQMPLCIGSPGRTPHVLGQALLAAGSEAAITAPAEPGRYRLFMRGGATVSVEVAADTPAEVRLVATGDSFDRQQVAIAPGGRIEIARPAGDALHVKLERVEWASQAATAHYVSTIPAFRRLFAGNVLRRGMTLKVSCAALLFTDLTASTALYTQEGDAAAFRVVQDHFEALAGIVERHRGVMVKTIGDAVMAAFADPADAVRAAVDMQRGFPGFRDQHQVAKEVFLKVGVYAGPCYVVTANKILDYFGQSVNLAARLQAKAEPGEIVVSADLATQAEQEGWLEGARVKERFTTPIKGLDAPVQAARIVVDAVTTTVAA